MSKIIGVTVGTPTSPKAMAKELKPVTSVNGTTPDENGNVELKLDIKTPQKGVDYWTEEDKAEMVEAVLNALPVAEDYTF